MVTNFQRDSLMFLLLSFPFQGFRFAIGFVLPKTLESFLGFTKHQKREDKTISIFKRNLCELESVKGNGQVQMYGYWSCWKFLLLIRGDLHIFFVLLHNRA